VADTWNQKIRRIVVATGEVTTPSLSLYLPQGVAADGSGNLYVTESSWIRKIVVATGEVTTLAGSVFPSGSADGVGSAAQFYRPQGIATDIFGNLFVADTENDTIRKIVVATQAVTTLAGTAPASGSTNGSAASARFNYPTGVAADGLGNLYVADTTTTRSAGSTPRRKLSRHCPETMTISTPVASPRMVPEAFTSQTHTTIRSRRSSLPPDR